MAEESWNKWTKDVSCPGCADTAGFARHGTYSKYHYRRRLSLLRVRCQRCGTTHALIPAFSLPGTSLGTAEVEQFVAGRRAGRSRRESGRALCAQGVGVEYLRRIEQMIIAAIQRAKALFGDLAPGVGEVYRWLVAAAGASGETRSVVTLNAMSIAAGYGAVFCSLAPQAGRLRKSSAIRLSHNTASAGSARVFLHSG